MARRVSTGLLAALLVLSVTAVAGADERSIPWGVANDARRQELRHRSWPDDGVPGAMLVTTFSDELAATIAEDEGGRRIGDRIVLLHVPPGSEATHAGRLAALGGVLGIEPDRVRAPAEFPNDPRYWSDQWPHRLTNADGAWDTSTGSASVRVAVLDTGIDGRHIDLRGNLVEQVDVSSGRPEVRALGTDNDACDVGHGTFVAGVVGAIGDNNEGVAGVAWSVSIVDVALTSPAARCGILDSAIIAGLEYVTDPARDGVDVVNLSLGGVAESCPVALQRALDTARQRGTLVVAAAGNDQLRIEGASEIPASCDGVLSVAAVGEDGDVSRYSNVNEWVDVAAPGGDSSSGRGIVSTAAGGGYAEQEGTSFAAPYVAGVAALLLSVDASLTPDDLESIIERTASYRGGTRDGAYGWGVVDAGRAVDAAVVGDPAPPVPDPDFPVSVSTLDVIRVKASGTTTDAIRQAVAASELVFEDDQALHAVLARGDVFADALAGSSLGFGLGPVLFASSTAPLAGVTANELRRVLEPGATVYLLGGTAALPATMEAEIEALGLLPKRLAGATRHGTAVAVAEELLRFLTENEFVHPDVAIVTTAANWPDAVSAGALGAWFGMPILLTESSALDAQARDFLAARTWEGVYVIGGTSAIAEDVRLAVRDASGLPDGDVVRLAGVDRSMTAVAVATEFERIYSEQFEQAFGVPAVPGIVAAVNLRRADGFAHVLSASAIVGATGGVFVPVEGDAGDEIRADVQAYVCRFPADGVVVGASDVVSDATATLFDELLKGRAPACH